MACLPSYHSSAQPLAVVCSAFFIVLFGGCTSTPGHCYTGGVDVPGADPAQCDAASTESETDTTGPTTAPTSEAPTTAPTTVEPSETDPTSETTDSETTADPTDETTDTSDTTEPTTDPTTEPTTDPTTDPTDATDTDSSMCGDGNLDNDESCDDGNLDNGDGCQDDCTYTPGAVSLALGDDHSCARLHSGAVRCWGRGELGELGHASTTNIGDTPDTLALNAADIELGGKAVELAAGGRHTCARLEDNSLRCWGDNSSGQLGYGHTDPIGDDETPDAAGAVPVGEPVVHVAAGGLHTCVLLESGMVKCWGDSESGQLGKGAITDLGDDEPADTITPFDVAEDLDVTMLAAGDQHSCALLSDGSVNCWGRNTSGQLGLGNTMEVVDATMSVPVKLMGTVAEQLSAGTEFTCAQVLVNMQSLVQCWGFGDSGRLGYGTGSDDNIGDDELLDGQPVLDIGDEVVSISSGSAHTCAKLASTGDSLCWGRGQSGRLGHGNVANVGLLNHPADGGITQLDMDPEMNDVAQVAAGGRHSCAIQPGGAVMCWGASDFGQLGYGSIENVGDNEIPADVEDLAFVFNP